ncbi:E3 ubiquitin-protein ligase TRIM39-like [Mixophyes fleayi]|uniref:E3 ubiquitin-protein ligase TRIM39-like n=1 Tax=Mixophyes fleayi TaxID=3061075 RepID=UPI003F4DF090
MASAGLRDELDCSICLNIYTDPVTLKCGHNFCQVCIDRALDTQEGSGVYSCPQCRAESQERPKLKKNRTLRNIVEHFLLAQPAKEEFLCTYCIHSPVPAVKSCRMCEASLCENHLRIHSKSAEHVITDPTTNFGKVKCLAHNQMFMYYCSEDALCLCATCFLFSDHRGHKVQLLSESSDSKKEKLMKILDKLKINRTETEMKIQSLQAPKKKLEGKAANIKRRVATLFTDIRRQLDDLEKKILQRISTQEKQTLYRAYELIQELEIKKDELSRKIRHIEQLCNVTDPVTFLQELDKGDIEVVDNEDQKQGDIKIQDIGDLDEDQISMTLHTGLSNIMISVKRGLYMEDAADIILDVDTAANNVQISGDLKTASWLINRGRPKTPQRFQYHQVISAKSFNSGRLYWDVETNESGNWMVGMTYPSIEREGSQAIVGKNNKSWCLCKWNNQYFVLHDKIQTLLLIKFSCHKFRLRLDYNTGRLSFYELCEPIRHLHTFNATFSEPLHAAISVWESAWVTVRSQEF